MLGEIVTAVVNAVTLKDVVGWTFTGTSGFLLARYTHRQHVKLAQEETQAKAKETAKQVEVAAADNFVKRELAQSENLTARFKLLMDGYENRINDLTEEVSALRETVEGLKDALTEHRVRCAACPHSQALGDAPAKSSRP